FATVSESMLEHNLAAMARFCDSRSLLFAPHGKTSMCPQLFAAQLRHGAWGITVATAWQARVCRELGVERVLMASQLADEAAVRWAAEEFARPENGRCLSLVDSVDQVALMSRALGERLPGSPLE